jgi:hypothetical protein
MVAGSLFGRAKVACDGEESQAQELEGDTINGHVARGQIDLFVCGRLAVLGEHSDWAGAMRRHGAHLCRLVGERGVDARREGACWRILYAALQSLCAAACRQNPRIAKGRTIVIGTSQGLYARAHALSENVIVVRTTTEDGQVFGPHRLALDPDTLVKVHSAHRVAVLQYISTYAARNSFCQPNTRSLTGRTLLSFCVAALAARLSSTVAGALASKAAPLRG